MRARHPQPTHRAFTLLEVLIAFAVFAMGAVVLGAAYVNILNGYAAAAKGDDAAEDLRFARGQLLAEPDVKKAEEGLSFDSGDRHVQWSAAIASTNLPDLFDVTLTCEITSPAEREPRRITDTFRALRPTWSDPVEQTKLRADVRDRILELQQPKQ
ncbi:prepilin-type N-terminal cleavage/methylation domain-containing protein [Horticoccus luteus]|uniref:Prepilin-type N-terminal cleavage/methylation domain-containing protein n=1 Tax=Horticoccus luteus TaxID=2862869 RepID=A0A8F9XKM1_9BACT|nr:prepilin-type N-terminal cleavage/methylation domain-containing protein [Horticoccus luteus]QYM78341.1 prepilin-type N-terminal cleavage/methylation domain-containing protein [Horticoccus luteus]